MHILFAVESCLYRLKSWFKC